VTGGWLTNHYQLDDPNTINLALAIFEPIAIVSVIAYWIWRKSFLYRLMSILALIQILVGAGFLIFILLFALTWHPKMMCRCFKPRITRISQVEFLNSRFLTIRSNPCHPRNPRLEDSSSGVQAEVAVQL